MAPCPFCGTPNTEMRTLEGGKTRYYVACFDCGSRGAVAVAEETAVLLWNQRAAPPLVEWIAVSERLPEPDQFVLAAIEWDRPGNWVQKVACYEPRHYDTKYTGGFRVFGGSWCPSHWMPLPAPPGQERPVLIAEGLERRSVV